MLDSILHYWFNNCHYTVFHIIESIIVGVLYFKIIEPNNCYSNKYTVIYIIKLIVYLLHYCWIIVVALFHFICWTHRKNKKFYFSKVTIHSRNFLFIPGKVTIHWRKLLFISGKSLFICRQKLLFNTVHILKILKLLCKVIVQVLKNF